MFKSLSLLSVALLLSSCSGNGWNYPAGTACDAGAFAGATPSPLAKNLPANSHKLTIPDQGSNDSPTHADLPDMPEGTYTFASADIFYSSKPSNPSEEPMLIQLHDDLGNENNSVNAMSMQCVRETTVQHFEPQTLNISVPTAFVVDSDKVSFTKRTFVFKFLSNQLSPQPTVVDPKSYSDISQIFSGDQKPVNWVIVNNPGGGDPNDYELRAEYTCPDSMTPCSYTVSVHMNYFAPGTSIPANALPQVQVPPAPAAKPAPVQTPPVTRGT